MLDLSYFKPALAAKEMQVLADPTGDRDNGLSPLVDEIQFKKVMAFIEEGKKQSPTPVEGGHRIGNKVSDHASSTAVGRKLSDP